MQSIPEDVTSVPLTKRIIGSKPRLIPSAPDYKQPRKAWTDDSMAMALEAVLKDKMTVREAAKNIVFQNPHSTIE